MQQSAGKISFGLSFLVALLFSQIPWTVAAQVIRDTTLPNPSVVRRTGNTDEITGGTERGSNLFHSFSQFSVPTGGTAFFNNANNIQNIITRVTGTAASNIDGLIRANGTANLFILNPNGFVFGPNARLDIGGSFIASTADRLRFADGLEFSATDPAAASPLTISAPIGLQYGRNAGQILVQGPGNGLSFGPTTEIVRSNRPAGLQVQEGRTLALLGGGVGLQGGNLTAEDGQIVLSSIASGEAILSPTATGWSVSYAPDTQFGDVALSQAASADVSGNAGGSIQVQGQRISLTEGSALLSSTFGNASGAGIFVNAPNALEITGVSRNAAGDALFQSGLYTEAIATAAGQAGNIMANAGSLIVTEGGQIASLTQGAGSTGNLAIRADQIRLTGVPEGLGPSSFSTQSFGETSTGSSGNILIEANRLLVADGAFVSSATEGQGNAGNITVRADSTELLRGAQGYGASGLFAQALQGSTGNGGNIRVIGDRLSVLDGARIEASTFSSGNAGSLSIAVNNVNLQGASPGGSSSGLFVEVGEAGSGNSGDLQVNARQLQIGNGAAISSSTFGLGNAGNINIAASEIEVAAETNRTGIFAAVNQPNAPGNGGNLNINADRLRVLNGAQIVTGTVGSGRAGSLRVNAQTVELTGFNEALGTSSGLFSSALIGTGSGGDIRVNANRLQIQNGARITAGNFPSPGVDVAPGQGPAGSIRINAPIVQLENGGTITASTAAIGQGNISIQSGLLLLSQDSTIATNSQGRDPGGNITLATDFLVARGNSDITANAVNARGGRITISAQSILGTQYQEQLTEESDITATSDLGPAFSGTVQINLPDIDPNQGLTQTPSTVQPNAEIVAACERLRGNEMVITGRGGLPADASQLLRSQQIWEDTRTVEVAVQESSLQNPLQSRSAPEIQPANIQSDARPIVEAQGWFRGTDGQIQLVVQLPEGGSQELAFHPAQCSNLSNKL